MAAEPVNSLPLLEVRDLTVDFETPVGSVRAVDRISFELRRGESLGVVGESGSGKSVTWLTVLGLLRSSHARVGGEILFKGEDLLRAKPRRMRQVRTREIAMIFQDPLTSLNPLHRVGTQIAEVFRIHEGMSRKDANRRAIALLDAVGIPFPAQRARQFPHEFSGGMRQRVMIAMALSLRPSLLIADEATTALDVTVQAEILNLLERLRNDIGATVVLISHDLGVVATRADRVLVMYAGRIVEIAQARSLFENPQHPYTWGLLGSIPGTDQAPRSRLKPIPGQPPYSGAAEEGCPFAPRCRYVMDICRSTTPPLLHAGNGQLAACHLDPAIRASSYRRDWTAGRLRETR